MANVRRSAAEPLRGIAENAGEQGYVVDGLIAALGGMLDDVQRP